jgi:adenylate cyclase
MSTDEVVDTSKGPLSLGRRRAWLRIGVPVGGAASVILAILAIALYSDRANRAGAVLLSDDLLDSLGARVSQEVTSYLDPAIRATRLVRDIVDRNAISDRSAALEEFASSALRQIPQIDALYSGDAEGNFAMVRRGEAGGVDIKSIRNTPDSRVVELIQRNADGLMTQHRLDPSDRFDPRPRDWYQGALKADDVYWTGVYVFYTGNEPGISAALRLRGADGADRVFGVDITLKALSDFLAALKIGKNGRAVIIDDNHRLIAAADASVVLRIHDGQRVTARLDEAGDPVLTAAYDRFRVDGYGRQVIEAGGARIISMASALPIAGQKWSLLLVVPEKDFTGFVARNERKTLWMSLLVILLAAGLAALLAMQGLRADRTARLLLDRGHAIERQSLTFTSLAREVDLFDRTKEAPLEGLTAALGNLAAARRISVWRFTDGGRLLHCDDAYECDVGGHVGGSRLPRSELPRFFAAIESGEEIHVQNAAGDPRTSDFHRVLMRSIDSRRVHVAPVRSADKVVGAIVLEDAAEMSNAREFAALFANVLAVRMTDQAAVQRTVRAEAPEAGPVEAGERSLDAELVRLSMATTVGAKVFESAAVSFLKFEDGAAMASTDPTGGASLADRVAAILQDIAAMHDIPYLKVAGLSVVAASGLVPEDTSAVTRIADASVAARDRCLELFEAVGRAPSFRIGVACGFAVGGHVGREPRIFNLWGPAVLVAELMAETSAGPGLSCSPDIWAITPAS